MDGRSLAQALIWVPGQGRRRVAFIRVTAAFTGWRRPPGGLEGVSVLEPVSAFYCEPANERCLECESLEN